MHPTGTVTFLFTDIEGSTTLWESYPQAMRSALARHDTLLREAIERCQGFVIKSTGDGMLAAFQFAPGAVDAAIAAQLALLAEPWSATGPLLVRMGIHTGEAHERDGDYYGPTVNRAARIMSLAAGSQVLLSTAAADLVRSWLPRDAELADLGLHRLRNIEQPEQLFQLSAPGLPAQFPPLTSLATANNLPLQTTSFLGRQRESTELRRLLEAGAGRRLVTIVGPGGIGKSRLSIEVSSDLADQFTHGAYFVPLAPLGDDRQIVVALGDSLGLRNPTGSDLRQGLLDYLRAKSLLLVLDNFEHVLAGADIVTDILKAAPGVKILITSREQLNLTGETVFLLSGLDYPHDARRPAEELRQYDAVQLLLDRARLVRPDWEVSGSELAEVVRICRLVQGMPLALVLAAGWLELLSFAEVAVEIAASLDILEGQARDMPERQRSVRAAFDYSWRRLEAEDQETFSRLSVFRGGFSRRAAQQVAGAGLRTLRTLVQKSLITAEGVDRFAVHELLRQFAEEKLEAAGQATPVRDAHSTYYLQAVAQREEDLKGRRQLEAMEEIDVDLDNLRTAWSWATQRRNTPAVNQALESVSLFMYMRALYQEGWALFRQALRALPGDPPMDSDEARRIWGRLTSRAELLHVQFARIEPQIEEALQQSLAIAAANGDEVEIGHTYLALGHYHSRVTRDYDQALRYFQLGLAAFQAQQDLYYVAHSLHRVGYSYGFGNDITEYMDYTRESRELAHRIGDLSDEANALGNLGWGSFGIGEYAAAEQYAREAIAVSRKSGEQTQAAHSLVLLGLCHVLNGRLPAAQEPLQEGVRIAEDIVFPLTQAFGFAILSLSASLGGDYALGQRLAGAAQQRLSNPFGEYLGHWAQAMALAGLDQPEQAWHHAQNALGKSTRLGWDSRSTWTLPVAGIILARQGHSERAVEILSLYFNHPHRPAGMVESWPLLREWQSALRETLGTDAYQSAWERGRTLDLQTAVIALLPEDPQPP